MHPLESGESLQTVNDFNYTSTASIEGLSNALGFGQSSLQGAHHLPSDQFSAHSPSKFQRSIVQGISLKCQQPGCTDDRIFAHESALKKHTDKHDRPYRCAVTNCRFLDFTTLGDLKRHQRQKHGRHNIICPVVSCGRHTRGFGRKDNLMEHLKRVHAQENASPSPTPDSSLEAASAPRKDDVTSDTESEAGNQTARSLSSTNSTGSEKILLRAKLQELETLKENWIAKMDGDIEAMKRVLSLM